MLILGIESSCDETAAAVVRDGTKIISSVISSQIELHRAYGGVVPEVASREHLEKIEAVVQQVLDDAGVSIKEIDAIAVTQGPGLVGSLLVGVSYAKALSYGLDVPLVGINHIEGHFFSVVFDNPPIEYPALALIVSGGHTNIFFVAEPGKYRLVSRTRDDAAGEAFDKVAKMLGLGYPGGPIIEKLAETGDSSTVKFTKVKISDGRPDFSFSGLKTAVARHLREKGVKPAAAIDSASRRIKDLAASFQRAVVDSLISTLARMAAEMRPKTLVVAGGVACNVLLRQEAEKLGRNLGTPVYFPSKHLSTDNAAMIAAAGFFHLSRGVRSDLSITADVTLRLQNVDTKEDELRERKVRYKL